RARSGGGYFALEPACERAVPDRIAPRRRFVEAMLGNLNYEGGANPNNVTFVTGLGWRRPREIVHQYAMNDRRVLPPSGLPIGSIQGGFMELEPYRRELGPLRFPAGGAPHHPFPF